MTTCVPAWVVTSIRERGTDVTNVERNHRRYVSTASYWARDVKNVRHLDCDLFQYCPKCKRPEMFFEVKSKIEQHPAHWELTRLQAQAQRGVAALIGEDFDARITCTKAGGCPCQCHTHAYLTEVPVRLMKPDGVILDTKVYNKPEFLALLARAHDWHCSQACDVGWFKC